MLMKVDVIDVELLPFGSAAGGSVLMEAVQPKTVDRASKGGLLHFGWVHYQMFLKDNVIGTMHWSHHSVRLLTT